MKFQNLDFISTFNNNNNNNKWNSVFDHLEISGKLEYNIASKLGTKYVASCGWTRDSRPCLFLRFKSAFDKI